jgi:predicted metalloprotease
MGFGDRKAAGRRWAPWVAVLSVLFLLTGCAASVGGTGTPGNGNLAEDVAASALKIIGDDQIDNDSSYNAQQKQQQKDFDKLVRNALVDAEQFWKKVFPSVSGGKQFEPLRGGVYSVTTGHPNTDNACMQQQPDAADNNAFYCSLDDSFAFDRTGLVGQLADHYGREFAMVVVAHEYGHLIQDRLNLLRTKPSIYKETQADCAAGAFTAAEFGAAVPGVDNPHFRELPPDLDRTVVGLILLRDSQPHSAEDQGTHGTGFDRGSAFADGFRNGVKFCYGDDWDARKYTERPYTQESDYLAGGNLSLDQTLSMADGNLVPDLNQFWADAFTAVGKGKSWQPVKVKEADHPACKDSSSQFAYCPDDNTIYYSHAIAEQVYSSVPNWTLGANGQVNYDENSSGDYALGTMFTVGFGLAVLHQAGQGIDDSTALRKAVCLAGVYSQNINVENGPRGFTLSPPDMDEATYTVLRAQGIAQPGAFGNRNTTGLSRIQDFRNGYLAEDASSC